MELISARDTDRPLTTANGFSAFFSGNISTDGTKVIFASWATNIVANDTNLNQDVFVYDFVTGSNWIGKRRQLRSRSSTERERPVRRIYEFWAGVDPGSYEQVSEDTPPKREQRRGRTNKPECLGQAG